MSTVGALYEQALSVHTGRFLPWICASVPTSSSGEATGLPDKLFRAVSLRELGFLI